MSLGVSIVSKLGFDRGSWRGLENSPVRQPKRSEPKDNTGRRLRNESSRVCVQVATPSAIRIFDRTIFLLRFPFRSLAFLQVRNHRAEMHCACQNARLGRVAPK